MKTQLKINENDIKHLKKSIEKYVNKVGTSAANTIADYMDYSALSAMYAFYSSYTPKVYDRHYYNFMDQSHRRFVDITLGYYEGGVELNSDFMDEIYDDPASLVFGYVYEGYHGSPEVDEKYGIPRMMPSPMMRIIEYRDAIASSDMKKILRLAQIRSS